MTASTKSSALTSARPGSAVGPLFLLDGHSLAFKAFYGVRGRLTSPDGMPTGAVYGFLRIILKLISDYAPDSLAILFDTHAPTFRAELFSGYKANREAPPPDFPPQMDAIRALVRDMGIATYELAGYEADDLIATMAREAAREGRGAVIISADKDLFQLIDDRTAMIRFAGTEPEMYDAAAVERRLGVRPEQVADWLALVGDSSDNIPGVPGIGEKGAAKLLQEFGSLDHLLEHPGQVRNERHRNSLVETAEQARLSRRLATVDDNVPFEWTLDGCRLPGSLWNDTAVAALRRLGFDSILRELGVESAAAPAAPVVDAIPTRYGILTTSEELSAWIETARKAPWLAFDTETSELDPMRAALVGISMSVAEGEAVYIPVGHRVGPGVDHQLSLPQLRRLLDPLLGSGEGSGPALAAHHAKYDCKILERAGFKVNAPRFDTQIASFVLDPARPSGHGLKALALELAGLPMHPISDLIGTGRKAVSMDELTCEAVYEYAARDADATLRLRNILAAQLDKVPTLKRLFEEVEMPLIPVLQRMEMGGFAVDPARLKTLSEMMSRELSRLTKEIWALADKQFNIDSTKQLAQVLFEDLKLPSQRKTKTGYSTDNEVLEALGGQHEIIQRILDYRGITKLKSTYADTLPREIHPQTGRIHTSFHQTIAQTGRLSSTEPNLQNIPIRTELGREIRRAFVPDSPEHVLLSADYSQIELRILAHFSGDEALRRAYSEGIDIHALTASRVFGVPAAEVPSELRAQSKVINFGIIYGMSAHGLSQRLSIGRAEAGAFIDAYFRSYPGVRRWIDTMLEEARRVGYVETMLGRRRLLPDLAAKNGQVRANAERVAVNTPIQGTSADMIKIAMINIARDLEAAAPGARMACQVHDELVFSVPRTQVEAATAFVRERMVNALPLSVPIAVDIATGENWADS